MPSGARLLSNENLTPEKKKRKTYHKTTAPQAQGEDQHKSQTPADSVHREENIQDTGEK